MKTKSDPAQQPQINVYILGGYNQILPNATHAVQNYYLAEPPSHPQVIELPPCIVSTQPMPTPEASPLDEPTAATEQTPQPDTPLTEPTAPEAEATKPTAPESTAPSAPFTYEESLERVTTYINKDYFLHTYAERLKLCLYVRDIAKILVEIARDDNAPLIDKERVVKSDFFSLFPPLCPRLVNPTTASNFRQHINNELMRRHKR